MFLNSINTNFQKYRTLTRLKNNKQRSKQTNILFSEKYVVICEYKIVAVYLMHEISSLRKSYRVQKFD